MRANSSAILKSRIRFHAQYHAIRTSIFLILQMRQITTSQKRLLEKNLQGVLKLVVIQSTTFCNLNCDYCYLPDRQSKFKFSLDLLEPIFSNLFTSPFVSKQFTVVWHAGEPLSMPISFYEAAFHKIEQLNHQLNSEPFIISQSIQTNGTLLNQEWCNLIKKYDVKLGVSLDGPAFIHDVHRKTRTGLGTHAGTMRGISLLKANDIDFSIIAVLTHDSLDYPEEIFNFFVENQIKYVGFNIDEIEGEHSSSSLSGNDVEGRYRAFMKRFLDLTKSTNGALQVREFESTRNTILGKVNIEQGQFTPFTMINIAYNGDFSTFSPELLSMKSHLYGDFILGNVSRNSFESVCGTEKFQKMNQDIQAGVKLCQSTCQYFSVCGGGAPANKYFENGSFRSAETLYCKYTKKVLVDLILEDIEASLGLNLV